MNVVESIAQSIIVLLVAGGIILMVLVGIDAYEESKMKKDVDELEEDNVRSDI